MQRSAVRPSPTFLAILAVAVAGGVIAAFADPYTDSGGHAPLGTAGVFLLVIGGWAASLVLHEFGHAFVAHRGGDREIALKGYLTLDIRRYTDPVLSLVLPLILLVAGGIPLPGGAVWVNHGALKSRLTASMVSLAGPASNLLLAVVITSATVLIPMPASLLAGLSCLALLQLLAFVLNILPVPGLDGYGAIEPYLSPRARELGHKARPWAPLVLFALIIGTGAGSMLWVWASDLYGVLGGEQEFALAGFNIFMFWTN